MNISGFLKFYIRQDLSSI